MCVIKGPGEERGEMSGAMFEEITAENFSKSDERHHHTTNSKKALQIPSMINKKGPTAYWTLF